MIVPALWKMLLSRSALSIFNLPVRSKFLISAQCKSDVDCRMQMANDPLGLNPLPSSGHQKMKLSQPPGKWAVNSKAIVPCLSASHPPKTPSSMSLRRAGKETSAPYSLKWPHKIHGLGIIGLEWHILSKSACFPLAIYSRSLFVFSGVYRYEKGPTCKPA